VKQPTPAPAAAEPSSRPGGGPRARNRTARAAAPDFNARAVGNPATARLESGVGNCFPGLEMDVRNLEGRFFPGILFRVVTQPLRPVPEALPDQAGIRLVYLDYLNDPMLPQRGGEHWVQTLLDTYMSKVGTSLSNGRWYLHWLEQEGKRIACSAEDGTPYDGETLWRFVRCLRADVPLKIAVIQRDAPDPQPVVELTGRRRRYTGDDGVIDTAYPPGELTESMCNPWQHDFRDCACYYWASNHPDVVLGEIDRTAPSDAVPADPDQALTWLDWLRRDRSPAGNVAAPPSRAEARAWQLDHFEINRRWQELAYVIEGHEVGAVYHPPRHERATPYPDAAAMIDDLRHRLAPLEMTLCCAYLYGLFSLRDPAHDHRHGAWATMHDDLVAARQAMTLLAVGEMTHLRWANQLLWELDAAGFYPGGEHYEPVLDVLAPPRLWLGEPLPDLQALSPDILRRYAFIERPRGDLDRAYARCVATLEQPAYPRHLFELAVRIDSDGVSHYERFDQLARTLGAYGAQDATAPYLRPLQLGTEAQAREALQHLARLMAALKSGYQAQARRDPQAAQRAITEARAAMDVLRQEAEQLARHGIGVPLFDALAPAP